MTLLHEDLTYGIIGACFEVHKELGCGYLEAVYQEALKKEFDLRRIPYHKEKQINISYKGQLLDKYYQTDFICGGTVLVGLKAVSSFDPKHEAQLINYLKGSSLKVGLLVNFGVQSLKHKRFVL